MSEVKTLLVVWQDEKSRLYYHIGTLSFYGAYYEFSYTTQNTGQRKLGDALAQGYMIHPAFPNTDKAYRSTKLFPAFDRRIPSSDRQDFAEILKDLGLTKDAGKMEILRATRGRLAADTYSFEQPLRREEDGKLRSSFFIHGMRHQQLPDDWFAWLKEGDTVKLIQESTNPYDKNAVAVYTQNNKMLGYVPSFYSQAIFSLLEKNMTYTAQITYLNEKSHPHWWVKLAYESEMPVEQTVHSQKLVPVMQ